MTGKNFLKFQAEVVQGKCPTCDELTLLVGLTKVILQMHELWC